LNLVTINERVIARNPATGLKCFRITKQDRPVVKLAGAINHEELFPVVECALQDADR
jgi:hypothetical protein